MAESSPECQLSISESLAVFEGLSGLTVTNYCHKAQQIINKKPQNARLHSFSLRVELGAAVTLYPQGIFKTQVEVWGRLSFW